jgi:ComF family protein
MDLIADLLALFFPEVCAVCSNTLNAGEDYICTDCRLHLPYTNVHLLPPTDNPIARRFFGRLDVTNVLSFFSFTRAGRVQALLHNLKYRDQPELGVFLGKWYGSELKRSGYADAFDLILPVPLHKAKLRQRGYNQSDKFAEGLAVALEIPWSAEILKREIYSTTQTHKSRYERWENVEKIFQVNDPEQVKEKRILLVDDVLTTGATLEACGQELLDKGCATITVATIAVA